MRNKLRWVGLVILILAIILTVAYWWGTPRLIAVSPPDGATAVPAGATLRLTFSREMQLASVQEHLTITPNPQGTFTWREKSLIFIPDSPWSPGVVVQVKLERGAQAAGLLPFPMQQSESWSFTIRRPRLIYLYPTDRPADIYLMDPASGESQRLTQNPGGVVDFAVASNGIVIYYSVRQGQAGSDIYRLDLALYEADVAIGGVTPSPTSPEPVRVLSCPLALCRAVALSPKGDFLAYERTVFPGGVQPDYPQVWYIPVSPTLGTVFAQSPPPEPTPLLAGDPLHQTLQPLWSPDGLLTFYDTNTQAFVILDVHSGKRTLFPNKTGQMGTWHPNGRNFVAPEIFFLDENISSSVSGLQALANSHLILFDRLVGKTEDLTQGEALEDTSPAFSPNGTYLAFARKYLDVKRWTPGRQLWLLLVGSGDAQPLTDEPLYNHFEFAWSPTGDQIAFVRFNQSILTEPPEIWLIDLLTSQASLLVKGGYAPQWIP